MTITQQLRSELAGRYEIDREIGKGGMATVYLARDVRHNRRVAVKVLNPDLGALLGVERFLSEIETTANLQHPNLLPLFDSGAAGTLFYYVMPFVDGESLRGRIDREKQLPVDEVVRLTVAVANALDYAHRHGVIHRDLKPENILLQDGQPLVADFGIALAVANAGGNRITQTGLSLGTPSYMSPEQATGDRSIDARTDVYSLAAVAYEMLTGDPPHVGSTSQAIIARLLTERPRSIRTTRPAVPVPVEAAIERALEKLPADRYATAKEFADALTHPSSMLRLAAPDATRAPMQTRRQSRVSAREKVIAGIAVTALSAVAWLSYRAMQVPALPPVVSFQLELPDDLQPVSANSAGSVAISRDGSLIVFQAWYKGKDGVALFARRLNAPGVQMIRGTEGGTRPVISPDGSEVLFSVERTLKRVAVEGGTPQIVADVAGFSSWGDANEVVYEDLAGGLAIVSLTGGSPRLLAAPDTARRFVGYGKPHILPGGRSALITVRTVRTSLDSMYLGVISIPSGSVTNLGIRGAWPRYADGHILYATSDNWLMSVPFSATDERITGAPERIQSGVRLGRGGAAGFGVSDNGVIIMLSSTSANAQGWELLAVSRSGVERSLGIPTAFYRAPRVSPDGKQVALTLLGKRPTLGDVLPVYPDIWSFDTASKVLTRISTDSSSRHAEWSSDGTQLVYVSHDTSIVSRPMNTTGAPTLLATSASQIAALSLNAMQRLVAFGTATEGGRTRADIFLASAESTSTPTRFLGESYSEEAPEFSPSGRYIAYTSYKSGRSEVYVRPVVGNAREVQISINTGFDPLWSRSGQELFYRVSGFTMSARLAATEPLEVVRRDTLFRDPYADSRFRNYDVFPGDKEFVVIRIANDTIGPGKLQVIANWKHGRQSRRY